VRPRQWLKIVPVLTAPLLTASATLASRGTALGVTLLAFLFASSAVYVLNDLLDRESDRLHPVKRRRPLASGAVSVPGAVVLLVVLLVCTAGLLAVAPPRIELVVGCYLLLNLGYCLRLKHQPLVDVSVVASGFVLRVLAGTIAAGLPLRPFLLICVYCACVALSLGKRRHELVVLAGELPGEGGTSALHRPVLGTYSVPFLDNVVALNLVTALVTYVAFVWLSLERSGPLVAVLTFPFAAYTVYRYLQLLMVDESGGDPVQDLAGDRCLRINLALWAALLIPMSVIDPMVNLA